VILDQLSKRSLTPQAATRTTQYVITVWKKASKVCGREWRWDTQDVPDVLRRIEGGELQAQTQRLWR